MTPPGKSSIDLGTDENGVRFTFEREDPYIARGPLEINVWDGANDEAASVTLMSDDVLTLTQTLEGWLDR